MLSDMCTKCLTQSIHITEGIYQCNVGLGCCLHRTIGWITEGMFHTVNWSSTRSEIWLVHTARERDQEWDNNWEWDQWVLVYLPPATKLGQGYIFTGVCDSVHGGGGGLVMGGACSRGGCLVEDPPGWLLMRKAASYWNAFSYAEMLTLVRDRDRDQDPLFPIVPVPFPIPPGPGPCSVYKPMHWVWGVLGLVCLRQPKDRISHDCLRCETDLDWCTRQRFLLDGPKIPFY